MTYSPSAMSLIIITVALCILGIPSVVYGMMTENHPVFIVGLILVVAAYLLIRRRLKPSLRDKR
jgi:hypothetical protein